MDRNDMTKKYGDKFIGNVIRITDERTILINAGKGDIKVGDIIQVYEPGDTLVDVDGTTLCNFDFIKDELEVVRTESQYSVCKKMESVTKTFSFALSPLLEHKEIEYIPLNIDKADIQQLKAKDPLVRVGDPIKLA